MTATDIIALILIIVTFALVTYGVVTALQPEEKESTTEIPVETDEAMENKEEIDVDERDRFSDQN